MNREFYKIINKRLNDELQYVVKNVEGCTSAMISYEKGTKLIVGKIRGDRFEILLKSNPYDLQHEDFQDIVSTLNNNYNTNEDEQQ